MRTTTTATTTTTTTMILPIEGAMDCCCVTRGGICLVSFYGSNSSEKGRPPATCTCSAYTSRLAEYTTSQHNTLQDVTYVAMLGRLDPLGALVQCPKTRQVRSINGLMGRARNSCSTTTSMLLARGVSPYVALQTRSPPQQPGLFCVADAVIII